MIRGAAIISGLLLGSFLLYRFGWNDRLDLDGLEWYLAALILGGIGLHAIFPKQWLAALALGLAPFVLLSISTAQQLLKDPGCCNLWPIGLAMALAAGLPVPLVGAAIAHAIRRRVPRFLCIGAVVAALVIGQLAIVESDYWPVLLMSSIHGSELRYAQEGGAGFTCDGTRLRLSGVSEREWRGEQKNVLVAHRHVLRLDCPSEPAPQSYRVTIRGRDWLYETDGTGVNLPYSSQADAERAMKKTRTWWRLW